ncbi:hypothetical protein [Thalassotalea agarivorans]|uniref:D-glycerate 3-kinase n=1 Tax=Thalassotalea agarivorans TaxID=349064 RepID=A0A1H9ZJP7_THASX|nr:hypothetical protein [Thalassotalea agarivorans]SES81921.1 D-glycerate 3-kinase [Thalassotalea agarivorans]
MKTPTIKDFLYKNQLDEDYIKQADKHFSRALKEIASHQKGAKGALVIGINGCQGSGKSTLAQYLVAMLAEQYQLSAITVSLDDFYYSKLQRAKLARSVHPLLTTRGVPGTHDLNLAVKTITALKQQQPTRIPRFDKSADNPFPKPSWAIVSQAYDIIILEGWCVASPPQESAMLSTPINALEEEQDKDGQHRQFVNQQLNQYQTLFKQIDYLMMLKAPSFDAVFAWRLEQEQKLAKQYEIEGLHIGRAVMSEQEVCNFISFFERITTHSLEAVPAISDVVYALDSDRNITQIDYKASNA